MADLLGRAVIRVDMVTAGALQSVKRFAREANQSLRDLHDGSNIRVTATLTDRTGTGTAAVRQNVAQLRALSPVDITVRFDDQSGQVTSTSTAIQQLRTTATGAGNAFRSVATRAAAAAAALGLVASEGRDAARALHDVTTRATAAAAALGALRTMAARAGNAVRTLTNRLDNADGRLDNISVRVQRLSGDMDNLGGSIDGVNSGLRDIRTTLPGLSGMLRGASTAAGGDGGGGRGAGLVGALAAVAATAGTAAAAIGAAGPLVAGIAAALAELAPAAGLAATGILAAASAGVALKLGMSGVGDAVKAALDPSDPEAYAEALKSLSPNARSFVEQIRSAQPAFAALRKQVQDRLFDNLDTTLQRTAKATMPALSRSVKQSADTLNLMARGVLNTAAGLGKSGALGQALDGANAGLKNLSVLPSTIVQGLVQVGAAAAPAFNRLTGAARGGIERLSDRMTKAFESGAMERSISRAVGLAKQLGQGLSNVGKIIGNVLGAADASGGGIISTFRTITGELAKVSATRGVQDALKSLFETMATVGRTGATLLGEALRGIAPVITALGPPAQTLVRSLGAGLTPVIRSLSPILTSAAESFGRIVTAVSPLVAVIGRLVSGALDGLAPILRGVGEQAALLAESASKLLGPSLQALPGIINPLLKLAGRFGSVLLELQNKALAALQPSLERVGQALGRVAREVGPLVSLFADFAIDGLNGLVKAADPAIRVAGKLAEVLAGRLARGLEKVATWAGSHRLELVTIFNQARSAVLAFTISVVEALPLVFGVFRGLAVAALDAFGKIINGMALLVGIVPGIGPKVKDAAKSFNEFRAAAKDGLDKAAREVGKFSRDAAPKLRQNRLEMDISGWQDQIAEAKRQLSDRNLPREKRARLLADIKQWSDNIRKAKQQIGSIEGVARKITVSTNARGIAGSAQGAIRAVKDGKPKINVSTDAPRVARSARGALGSVKDRRPQIRVGSNARSAARATARALNNIGDENVYIRVSRIGLGEVARRAGASGGLVPDGLRRLQGGGPVRGPGTETSDSIPALLSRGEFVVRAAAVHHYGPELFNMLNTMRVPALAAGGAGGRAGTTVVHNHVTVENHGVLGSPHEVQEWLVRTLDHLHSQRRLPGARGGRAA